MGGYVALAVRYESGETICIETHTNVLPGVLKCREVLHDKDEKYMREFIAEMVAPRPVEPICNSAPLAPTGYGLNVVDFMGNAFLTMQGHASFDSFTDVEMALHGDRSKNFFGLASAGKIKLIRHDTYKGEWHKTEAVIKDAEEAISVMEIVDRNRQKFGLSSDRHFHFEVVDTTLEVFEFEENRRGMTYFKRKMEKLGFVFTADDEDQWRIFRRDI